MNSERILSIQAQQRFQSEAMPHIETLQRAAFRLTKNTMDAQDLVQETLLRAYQYWNRFKPGTNCRAWLFRIMKNQHINEYRKQIQFPASLNVDDLEDSYLFHHSLIKQKQAEPDHQLFTKYLENDMTEVINAMRSELRQVIVLYFFRGYSYQQIAVAADLRLGTVKSRLYRGKELLRCKLCNYAKRNRHVGSCP